MNRFTNFFVVLIVGGLMLYLLLGAWILRIIERIFMRKRNDKIKKAVRLAY
jgi:hypothetical protein